MDQNIDNNKETNKPVGIQRIIGQKMAVSKETDLFYETISDVSCDKHGNVTVLFSDGKREQFPVEMVDGMMCGCQYIRFIKKELPIDDNITTVKENQEEIHIVYSIPNFYGDVYLSDTTIGVESKFYNTRVRVFRLQGLIGKKMCIQDNDEKPIIAKIIRINKSHDELYFTFLNGEKKFENVVPFHFSAIRIDYYDFPNEYLFYYDDYGLKHELHYSLYQVPSYQQETWEERKWNLATSLYVAKNSTIDIKRAIAIADDFVEKYIAHEND